MFIYLQQLFAAGCASKTFLGLVPWYKYLDIERDANGACNIKDFQVLPANGSPSDIPLILLAVVDDLLRIAGLIAVIFVIYGAVLYTTSQGNPDQTSKAQTTIINSLVGLVISILAVVFVSFIGNRLG